MLTTALVLFALAALGGAVMLTFAWRERHVPKGIAVVHGALAATAIVLLAIHSLRAPEAPGASLALFVVAAVGGVYVLFRDLRDGRAPKLIATAHGLVAVIAFVLLYLHWSAR
jgi:hypothetical protein